jgi:hypothetical protein
MFGLIGWRLYALAAIGLVIAGLSVAVWGYRHKAAAAEARVHEVVGQRDRALAAAKASEETIKRLGQLNDELNKAIVMRDKRAKALEEARRKLRSELDEIKLTLPAEDQSCLARSLPQPLIDRLRGGPGDTDADRTTAGARGSASPVPNL